MKIKKILIVLLFPLIAELFVSCCNCIDPIFKYYSNKNILVKNIDNSGKIPIITTANSVPKEAFGIRIQISREKTACSNSFNSLFIQAANATRCECPPQIQLLAEDSITSIQFFTLNDFDTNHPANSDISDYFKIFKGNSFNTIADFIKMSNSLLYSKNELELSFDALLMSPPSLNRSHNFKIKVTLSDGRMLEGITNPIDLI